MRETARMGRGVRNAVLVSLVAWLFCLSGWIILLAGEAVLGCPPLMEDSDYGETHWTWAPPGNRCTWSLAEGTHVEYPATARFGMLVLFVFWPVSTVVVARAAQHDRRDDAA
ncbi:hypothetical protein [Parafrankia sp. FMc2]|uniref:hypothetical protein n=1 Tax=Parafrankia sp. FMc2 TaxID=3233196 RepID=UPI0034D59585